MVDNTAQRPQVGHGHRRAKRIGFAHDHREAFETFRGQYQKVGMGDLPLRFFGRYLSKEAHR